MKTSMLGFVRLGALGFVLAVCPFALANATAKSALKTVEAAAKKWQADAVLTHISTLNAKPDGKAASWLYTYYSPKAKKSAIVTAAGNNIETDEVRNTSVDPLAEGFLDSDKVVAAAVKAGLKLTSDDLGLGLTTFGQATGKPRVYWTVTVMTEAGFSSVTLDPNNGALIKKDDVKLK
jgi:hypothetical protein